MIIYVLISINIFIHTYIHTHTYTHGSVSIILFVRMSHSTNYLYLTLHLYFCVNTPEFSCSFLCSGHFGMLVEHFLIYLVMKRSSLSILTCVHSFAEKNAKPMSSTIPLNLELMWLFCSFLSHYWGMNLELCTC